MKKIKINDIFINLSIILITMVMLARVYIIKFMDSNISPVILLFVSMFLLFLAVLKNGKIYVNEYSILCLLILIPFFYQNAYFEDRKLSFLYYICIIANAILLSFANLSEKQIKFVFNIFITFAILTSIVTWLSFISPDFYINKIVTLLPLDYRDSVILLLRQKCYSGLTDHYSRNAFYIILGIMGCIYKMDKSKKINVLLIGYFLLTSFLIGKRGHLLFLILSAIITYFIYNRVKIKTMIKFSAIILVFIMFVLVAIKLVPGVRNVYDRIFKNNGDISTGRVELYEDAFKLYEYNEGPIGWGQFAKSTGYSFAGVHNDYIQIFVETGILGCIMIFGSNLLMLFKSIKLAHKDKNMLSFIILLYNVFFLTYALTGIPHYDVETLLTYFILNGILYNRFMNLKKEKLQEEIK